MSISKRRDKTVLPYYVNGIMLESVDNFVDLGVIICDNLSWSKHVASCVSKARK